MGVHDISDRQQMELALQESEAKMRSIVDTAADGIITIDEKGVIDSLNTAAERIFGYKSEEVIGRNVSILMPSPYREEHDKYISNYLRTGEKKIIGIGREVVGKRKDGTTFPLDLAVSEMRFGDRRMFTGIIRDITDYKVAEEHRKSLEEQLRQSQKLESLGTLAGGIAHDFKNILGIILGCASILEEENLDPEKKSQSVAAIKETAERGAGLVRRLLAFARKTEVEFTSVNINEAVIYLTNILKDTFPSTITLSVQLDDNIPLIVADPNQLYQALLNLCLNARDAMPHGGTLTLKTEAVAGETLREKIQNLKEGPYVCLRVMDSGDGMAEETRARIFEPFFTTKALGKGSGLGLAVVYGIIKVHRGFIDVESEIGHGTTFHVYFPAAPDDTESNSN